jgi:Bifunctional DNA primase/polymerase, N-terminal
MPRDLNRDFALRLAEAGFEIFPCGQDKIPLVKWKTMSTGDPEAVAEMWHRFPGALPAVDLAKADLLVLDGDRHAGPDGRAALRALLQRQPDFSPDRTPTTLTPGDGVHAYFRQNGHGLGNAEGDLPDGINVRGHGGYVISPYAVLANGKRYFTCPGTPDLIAAFQAGSIPQCHVAPTDCRWRVTAAAAAATSPGLSLDSISKICRNRLSIDTIIDLDPAARNTIQRQSTDRQLPRIRESRNQPGD